MSSFLVVFKFEMKNYLKSKSYLLSTLIIVMGLITILFLPSFLPHNPFALLENEPEKCYAIVDKEELIDDLTVFEKKVPFSKIVLLDSESELEEGVTKGVYDAGLIVKSLTEIEYVVYNTQPGDQDENGFKAAIASVYRTKKLEEAGIDTEVVQAIYDQEIVSDKNILGKDGANSYVYTYILAFVIYMMVILHGQMIAVAITTEKSNRAMEILVTSAKADVLIFGKVLAGTVASFMQSILILGIGINAYQINAEAWGHRLDFIFNIPGKVLLTFACFGTMGFVFYAFIFGAMGALASRVEDVSKSISMITFVFIVVFLIGMYGMSHSEGALIKVASFIPFSSCIAMFIRVAMGKVSFLELDISLMILTTSTILTGAIGSKVYRLGTMRYGKQVSIVTALENVIKEKE